MIIIIIIIISDVMIWKNKRSVESREQREHGLVVKSPDLKTLG